MDVFLGKSKLDSLNTKINYDYFDKYRNNCDNYPQITAAKHLLDGGFWEKNIFDELLNALCYVYIKKENNTLNENLCNYLYYWLGSKVLTNLRLKNFFYEVVSTIYRILSKGELGKVCDPVKYSIYDYYNFYKFKEVYDLSEDYNTYKSHFIIPNPSCDKNYQDELKTYVYLYNKLRDQCSIEKTNYNAQYCKVFNNYFTNKEDEEISSWICKLKESEEHDQQLEEPRVDAENVPLPERHGLIVGQKLYRQGLFEIEEFPEYLSALNNGVLAENTVMGSASVHPDDSSTSTIKKSVTSAVSAAGVLVPPSYKVSLIKKTKVYI
ncbi:Plasmodium vivax Vir protein, putative [Plasmodium vivax]|uniref:Vir protein, putative n=1 Tax=Plasmodium vivax TaxID=5855 RepID=A0A1G4E2K1_PLAVI|nr:Plasmodium vivax Vir protein, putative [Plasmodium vivax]